MNFNISFSYDQVLLKTMGKLLAELCIITLLVLPIEIFLEASQERPCIYKLFGESGIRFDQQQIHH